MEIPLEILNSNSDFFICFIYLFHIYPPVARKRRGAQYFGQIHTLLEFVYF